MSPLSKFLFEPRIRAKLEQAGISEPASIVWLTPQDATSNSVIALVLGHQSSEPAVIIKIPRLPEGDDAIAREAATLQAIHRASTHATIPAVLAVEVYRGRQVLLETALVGETISPDEIRRDPQRCIAGTLSWLAELPTAPPRSDAFERLVERPLLELSDGLAPDAPEIELVARTLEVLEPLREAALPTVAEHGDLTNPNLIRLRDGRIGVVDWELGEIDGLAGSDLCFFLGYIAQTVRRARSSRELTAAFDAAFRPGGWAWDPLRLYARGLGIEPVALEAVLLASWARYTARLAARIGGTPAGLRSRERGYSVPEGVLATIRATPHYLFWQEALGRRI